MKTLEEIGLIASLDRESNRISVDFDIHGTTMVTFIVPEKDWLTIVSIHWDESDGRSSDVIRRINGIIPYGCLGLDGDRGLITLTVPCRMQLNGRTLTDELEDRIRYSVVMMTFAIDVMRRSCPTNVSSCPPNSGYGHMLPELETRFLEEEVNLLPCKNHPRKHGVGEQNMTRARIESAGNTTADVDIDPTETPEELFRRLCEDHEQMIRDIFPSNEAFDKWFNGNQRMDPQKTVFALTENGGSTRVKNLDINVPFADQIPDSIKKSDSLGEPLEFTLTVAMKVGAI